MKLGFNREKITEKLTQNSLMGYVLYYDQVFTNIYQEIKPSNDNKIKGRIEFEELAKKGICEMSCIGGKI